MEVKSTSKYVRLSPKKARDVAREIQGLPVSSALDILNFTPKKAAQLIGKTLKTAIADAEEAEADVTSLWVARSFVDEGMQIKRFQPKDRGRAHAIIKQTSHITVCVEERA